ncbi:unnamed protein product [Penicillium salamii]|nr:unnamed protein product [Penicillium salamii]
MKFSTRSRLDQLVSTTALSFSVAFLVCLSFVFVGCSSPSSPRGLHFLKRGRNAVEGVVSNIDTSPKDAINAATSAASDTIQAQIHDLKSHLPRYYIVGLWSYCKAQNGPEMVCSDPSTSFSFDLSAVLDSAPKKVSEILPDIDQSLISGYRRFSQSVIWL